jgi:putative DNA methylase
MATIKAPKKLIEVALPLDDINAACAYEKMPGIGAHPRGIHLWWARRPLAAARAVIFAQMVNDPGYERNLGRGVNKEKAKAERDRLFDLIRRLVRWDNINNEEVLDEARREILRSWQETCQLNKGVEGFDPEDVPAFHDPFSGGGALPLEAQRLGLTSFAADLNPVAVLINKAMVEIPPRFSGIQPVGTERKGKQSRRLVELRGPQGLAEDVRRYGELLQAEVAKKIGNLYPQVELPKTYGGGKADVIAWIWARTVRSSNPAFSHVDVPLVSTFILSNKEGKEAYVHPVVNGDSYSFEVLYGKPPADAKGGTKLSKGANFRCLLSGAPIESRHIYSEARAGRLGVRLMAIVAEGQRSRVYLAPTKEAQDIALSVSPDWRPEVAMPENPRWFSPPLYGLKNYADIFTSRQLVALGTFSELLGTIREQVKRDALAHGMAADEVALNDGGSGAAAYADAITVYLAFAIDRCADFSNTCTRWVPGNQKVMNLFGKQAVGMTWDFPEANILLKTVGGFMPAVDYVADCLETLPGKPANGSAEQSNASTSTLSSGKVISTDPPYYDNIGYADLSDFFYVWLRRTLRPIFPSLFQTVTVPKMEELVATPYRHGGKEAAEKFFLDGMTSAMRQLAERSHSAFPTTIYYAFKQSETTDVGTGNTGWETFLEAVIRAGYSITGTWPLRSEQETRMVGIGTNALASSIVLVCRKREPSAPTVSRREFIQELKDELKEAVEVMIGGAEGVSPVAPVDLAQAVIGPGMAIYSKYAAVLEANGNPMTVHTALTLINRMLTEGADELDADTQFCLSWFDEHGWAMGEFGKADVLARAKGTSVDRVRSAGVAEAAAGRVRLMRPAEYPSDWSPEQDNNTPVWEALHQLIRALRDKGESSAGELLASMPQRAEPIRSLAYRLYTLCERKGWADDARAYNELIGSWIGIEAASHEIGHLGSQTKLDI